MGPLAASGATLLRYITHRKSKKRGSCLLLRLFAAAAVNPDEVRLLLLLLLLLQLLLLLFHSCSDKLFIKGETNSLLACRYLF